MAAANQILKGPVMDWSTDEGLYSRFKIWKQQCELLFTGPLVKLEEAVKCKYLLFWSGRQGLELFNSWDLSEDEQKLLENYFDRFENFVKPHSNELMAAWELYNLKQGTLSLEEFIAKLRLLVKEANYPTDHQQRFLRDFLVFGMNSHRVRRDCLKEGNSLTFQKAKDLAKAEESADSQLKAMNKTTEVNSVRRHVKIRKEQPSKSDKTQPNPHTPQKACFGCGKGPHSREKCPAKNVECYYCHKIGHLSKVCFAKKKKQGVNQVGAESTANSSENLLPEPDMECLFTGPVQVTPLNSNVNAISSKEKALLDVKLSSSLTGVQKSISCKIDSGAETNIVPKSTYSQLYPKGNKLEKPTVKLTAYGGTEIPNLGSCKIYVQGPHNPTPKQIPVEIVDVDGPAIIGNKTAQELDLLKLNWPVTTTPQPPSTVKLFDINGKEHPTPLTKEHLLTEYKDVFTGIGLFPGQPYHIEVDESIPPVQHPPRQVPVHLQPAYQKELERLKELGIITEVQNEYTPWINSTVVTSKADGSIRLCLDPRDLNKAIKRNLYYTRTIDDVIPQVSGATHFSILDARSGYWQVQLDEESSKLCTFSTPWGKYRWNRLPFGLTCSGDIFQEKMDSTFAQTEGLSGIADDTFVYGKSETDHDRHILNTLDTARANNVKFNPDKFQFKVKETSFFGLTWTADGLKPDAKKVKSIVDMPPPQNLTELQSFMGMINYLNRFSPTIAQVSEPLRQLMKREVAFVWLPEHQRAFQELKQIITDTPVLAYYDPDKENLIQSDASLKGLGCVLLQDGKPVCYASRSLSDAETRYSNIERELLAACWSLEKLNHYVYGKKVVLETDHKPLESIWKKSIASASPRLQRLLLRMAKYDVEIKYIPGKTNVVADALSRVSYMEPSTEENAVPEIQVDTITSTLPTNAAKLQEIREETDKDETLCHLKDVVYHGWPEFYQDCPSDLKDYWNFREDLSVENGLVLKGHRLVIPPKLRQQMMSIIHQGHMGTEKCLLKAKDCLFWPGISKDIKELTSSCSTCIKYSRQQPKEPLHQHNVPSYPWQKLGSDLFDYRGSQYLLVADYYSKFPIIRRLNALTSNAVIHHLKSIFAENGIPEVIVTDNGPQYSSQEFKKFCKEWGVDHKTSSPLYPQSNGFSERMVQTVKGLLKKSEAAGEDPYLALLSYRSTPVDSKLGSPGKLLNQRNYRTQLPTSGRLQRSMAKDDDVLQLHQRQQTQRQQHDNKFNRELKDLPSGQAVAVYQPQSKTWTSAEVKEKSSEPRSYVVNTPSGSELRRNRAHLKPLTEIPLRTTVQGEQAAPSPNDVPSPPTATQASDGPRAPVVTQGTELKTTRSGRIVKPPVKLNLYIKGH